MLELKRLSHRSLVVSRGIVAAQPIYAPGILGERAQSSTTISLGLFRLQAPYRSGDVSAIAPDASKGDTLSVDRIGGQKTSMKLVETSIVEAWERKHSGSRAVGSPPKPGFFSGKQPPGLVNQAERLWKSLHLG